MLNEVIYPNLSALFSATVAAWPEHRKFLEKSYQSQAAQDLKPIEELAGQIRSLIGENEARFIEGYRWMCEIFVEEEIYFRRNGKYRCTDFSEAFDKVYNNSENMGRYMDGLLLSQVLWSAHTEGYLYFVEQYLPKLKDQYTILEIGCGHGLLLTRAASDPRCAGAEGWDVSPESLEHSRETLEHFDAMSKVTLRQADLFAAGVDTKFDALVLSELLEHLEDPTNALKTLRKHLKPESLTYLNIPINSPAPDHITLWKSIDEVLSFVKNSGYTVLDWKEAPMSGYSLEKAKKLDASINCLVTARPTI